MIGLKNDPAASRSFFDIVEEDQYEAGAYNQQRVPTIISLNLKFNEKQGMAEEYKSLIERGGIE
jgi:hypothetical protein